jgi:hypothetical protein
MFAELWFHIKHFFNDLRCSSVHRKGGRKEGRKEGRKDRALLHGVEDKIVCCKL